MGCGIECSALNFQSCRNLKVVNYTQLSILYSQHYITGFDKYYSNCK